MGKGGEFGVCKLAFSFELKIASTLYLIVGLSLELGVYCSCGTIAKCNLGQAYIKPRYNYLLLLGDHSPYPATNLPRYVRRLGAWGLVNHLVFI